MAVCGLYDYWLYGLRRFDGVCLQSTVPDHGEGRDVGRHVCPDFCSQFVGFDVRHLYHQFLPEIYDVEEAGEIYACLSTVDRGIAGGDFVGVDFRRTFAGAGFPESDSDRIAASGNDFAWIGLF